MPEHFGATILVSSEMLGDDGQDLADVVARGFAEYAEEIRLTALHGPLLGPTRSDLRRTLAPTREVVGWFAGEVELHRTTHHDGRVEWMLRGPGCEADCELGSTDRAERTLRSALAIITKESTHA